MQDSRRYFILILFLGVLAILAFIFHAFLIDNFARPLAILFWFILRLFSAVDQKIYWILLIFFAFFQAARHIPKMPDIYARYPETFSRSALENLKNWRAFITLTTSAGEIDQHNLLRQNLTDLLISLYGTDQEDGAAAYDVFEALKSRQIPLPDPVYRFVFLEAPVQNHSLLGVLQRIRRAPRRWIRRLRGEDVTEYYTSIGAVLAFIETELEMPHDNPSVE